MKLTRLFEQEKSVEVYSDSGHSTVLRILPFRSLNRRICGSLLLTQISQGETSLIPRTLGDIAKEVVRNDRARFPISYRKFN